MRSYIAIFAAFAMLFAFAQAECCDQTDGLSGHCDDGTDSTPCCANGKCNIFCCNCDDGCRKETYDGCVAIATRRYGPYSGCNFCPFPFGATPCLGTAVCQEEFDDAMASCKSRFPQSKRTINPASALTPMKRQSGRGDLLHGRQG
ncbi:hypothetical protein FB567DRAFT_546915 [Paraphoma chrysanthemicola]|uniref:Secreted protein n=1 Tax=Paraphoma chrysanthemicola TaxID=798071 RepID=A0A8K0R9K2_9PLEO|nr:hypothetical protein FB567DRAFT_546915 [Paraphoma chrysanthemicola]